MPLFEDDAESASHPNIPQVDILPDFVELRIVSSFVSAPDVVIEPDADVVGVIGQMMQHIAQSNVPILGVVWTIAPAGNPVLAYNFDAQAGLAVAMPLTVTANPITFAWSTPVVETVVGVYITTPYGTGYVSHSFTMNAPTVANFMGIGEEPYVGPWGNGDFLRLGHPGVTGMTIVAQVTGDATMAGTIGILQIAYNQRYATDLRGNDWVVNINAQPCLDVGPNNAWVFYQDQQDVLPGNGMADLDITDSPSVQLGSADRFVFVGAENGPLESYDSYLMYQPAGVGNIWVPLSMLQWFWSGAAEAVQRGIWEGPGDNAVVHVNAPILFPGFPDWSANTAGAAWIPAPTGEAQPAEPDPENQLARLGASAPS